MESIEDLVPEKIDSEQMLDDLNDHLESDEEFKRKLVHNIYFINMIKLCMFYNLFMKKNSIFYDMKINTLMGSIIENFAIENFLVIYSL